MSWPPPSRGELAGPRAPAPPAIRPSTRARLKPGKRAPDGRDVTPPSVPGTTKQRIAAALAMLLVALGDELVRQLVGNPALRPF
jgi:hypothetical protein